MSADRLLSGTRKRKISPVLIGLFFVIASVPVAAAIYQWQDAQGKQHFSDAPQQGARQLKFSTQYSYYRVKQVFDGDTVQLDDKRKVRLLSVNTPEVEGRNKREEAGGVEAKKWLINKLLGQKVRLEVSGEKKDKYGRTLAHLFTEDGEHINVQLVRLGLASVNIYPKNLLYSKEMVVAGQLAEIEQLGIWKRPEYAVKMVDELTKDKVKGWQRVQGVVKSIREARKYVYLVFSDHFTARIERKWLLLFPNIDGYKGQNLEVRGWINRRKDRFSLLIRHPSVIRLLD